METENPFGSILKWNLTVEEMHQRAETVMEKAKDIYNNIASLEFSDISYDSVLKALAESSSEYLTVRNMLTFLRMVSPNEEVRNASKEVKKTFQQFETAMNSRKDIFNNLVLLKEKCLDNLPSEAQYYLKVMIKFGERNGNRLPDNVREEISKISKNIKELRNEFNNNLNFDQSIIEVNSDDLTGVPQEIIQDLDQTESKTYLIPLTHSYYFIVMSKIQSPEIRKKIELEFNSRCSDTNSEILKELIKLRHKQAQLLGYENYASYVLEMKMAKTTKRVEYFLSELTKRIKVLQEREMEIMIKLKQNECETYGYEFDGALNPWDCQYYMSMLESKFYPLNKTKIMEYFPFHAVIEGILHIFQKLLSLKFEEILNPHIWSDDVEVFAIIDKEDCKVLGYFYLDLYMRDGKYPHAASYNLQPSCIKPNGIRQVGIAALVANFIKPTANNPSLLSQEEIEMLFHELGHVIYYVCSKQEYALFSGTDIDREFTEAICQIFENWAWEKDILKLFSRHYQNGSQIPEHLLDSLIQSKVCNTGMHTLGQILLASLDFYIHTKGKVDAAVLFKDLSKNIVGIPASQGTNVPTTFGYLSGKRVSQYYCYLWSEMLSKDMFYNRFKKDGLLNYKVGLEFRQNVLQEVGSMPANDLIIKFLGRKLTADAFFLSKGLGIDNVFNN